MAPDSIIYFANLLLPPETLAHGQPVVVVYVICVLGYYSLCVFPSDESVGIHVWVSGILVYKQCNLTGMLSCRFNSIIMITACILTEI